MASGMKTWSMVVGTGFFAVVVLALPPRSIDAIRDRPPITPEREAAERLRIEAMITVEQLRRMAWLESQKAEVQRAAGEGRSLSVGVANESNLSVEVVRRNVEAELSRIGATIPAVDLGVFEVDRRAGVEITSLGLDSRFATLYLGSHSEWYAGSEGGRPWCVAMRVAGQDGTSDRAYNEWRGAKSAPFTNILGPCGFYARYGLPGRGMAAWLEQTGGTYALRRVEPNADPVEYDLPTYAALIGVRLSVPASEQVARVAACARGKVETCEAAVTGVDPFLDQYDFPRLRREDVPLVGVGLGGRTQNPFMGMGEEMLDRMERDFGAEAFGRFWASDQPMPEAFQGAFGVRLGEWVRDRAREAFPAEGADAAVAPSVRRVLLGLAWLALAALFATLKARKRTLA